MPADYLTFHLPYPAQTPTSVMEHAVQAKVIYLQTRRPSADSPICPAQFYKFTGDPNVALKSEAFMDKAAAFQEIRDCLIAADHDKISAQKAEHLITHLVRTYLATY